MQKNKTTPFIQKTILILGMALILFFLPHSQAQTSTKNNMHITVNIARQELSLFRGDTLVKKYPCSTSKYGTGSLAGSNKTPLGKHLIREMIGKGQPAGMCFVARQPSKVVPIIHDDSPSPIDAVLTRIMWLEGTEQGKNKGANVDSHARYIYIHGTDQEGRIGTPASHGCIRMKNDDVIELFEAVATGTAVVIEE